jgi:hypothetical protein
VPIVLSRAVRVVTTLILAELGVLVGVAGAFVHNVTVTLGGLALPAGLFAALGAVAGALVIARRVSAGRLGAAVTAATWLLTVLLLSIPRPEGDLVIADGVAGYTFLWGGAILAAVIVTLPTSVPGRT